MAILSEQDIQAIKERLSSMTKSVKFVLFTQKLGECQYCKETEELLRELTSISDKMTLEVRNLSIDKELAKLYDVDKVPAIVMLGSQNNEDVDYGIRFYGIPAGYEFATLLEDIIMISNEDSHLDENTKLELEKIEQPVKIKVFITPTCPHCPQSVFAAHQLAFQSKFITSEMIEASEFPQLSNLHSVRAVPKTIINDKVDFEGAMPINMVMEYLKKAVD
ncbi:thioredoxin family protein [bacterium]|nr:thioredoxin family protein [bacterium]